MNLEFLTGVSEWYHKGGHFRINVLCLLLITIILVTWFGIFIYDKYFKGRERKGWNIDFKKMFEKMPNVDFKKAFAWASKINFSAVTKLFKK